MKANKKQLIREFYIPTIDEEIATSKDTTVNTAKAYESAIIIEPDGSKYTMSHSKFLERYNVIDTTHAETKPITIEFIYNTSSEPVTFLASWGEDTTAQPGAAIVFENSRIGYAIQPLEFIKTYDVQI